MGAVVSLDMAAQHLRLDSEDDAQYVEGLIEVAEEAVADYLGRSLVPWVETDLTVLTPAVVRQAVLLYLGDLYQNRSAQVEKSLSANPTVDRLLHFHRVGLGI